MNTFSCFLFLLQLVSEFIILYTCFYLAEEGGRGPLGHTLNPPLIFTFSSLVRLVWNYLLRCPMCFWPGLYMPIK